MGHTLTGSGYCETKLTVLLKKLFQGLTRCNTEEICINLLLMVVAVTIFVMFNQYMPLTVVHL